MLTQEQRATLEALINRVIPADEFPSGWEAGVGDYLMRQFQGDLTGCLGAYRGGLDSLDREAQSVEHRRFAQMLPAAQDALLVRIEAGDVTEVWLLDPQQFFRMIVGHAMEGFYADPGNGGNRDGVSWRMIGFEVHG